MADDPVNADEGGETGRFLGILAEKVLGPAVLTGEDVATASGMSEDEAETLWMELGFPPIENGVPHFTTADAEILGTLRAVQEADLVTPEVAVAMTRVLGQALARVAAAMAEAVGPALDEVLASGGPAGEPGPGRPTEAGGDPVASLLAVLEGQAPGRQFRAGGGMVAAAGNAEEAGDMVAGVLIPTMERFLTYTWRRHLVAAVARQLDHRPTEVVGFADLVGYTRLTTKLPEGDLPDMIARFQHLAGGEITKEGGRVVKLIGDAVMFVVPDAGGAARAALGLRAACEADRSLPELRIGLARGPLVGVEGDVYGDTVNRASRLVELARPGTILADDDCAGELVDSGEVLVRPLQPRKLKGIGFVRAWSVRGRADR